MVRAVGRALRGVRHATLSWAMVTAPPLENAASGPTATVERPSVTLDPCRRGRRNVCRELRIGGGVTLGLGLVGLGTGIGLVAIDDEPLDGSPGYRRAYRPAGAAVIPLAVVLVVTGALLLARAVRLERSRRGRRGR